MKLLLARERGGVLRFRVHLDEGRLGADGQPDPAWIEEWRWTATAPDGRTRPQYLADIRRELRLLADARLADLAAPPDTGVALPGEGQTV